MERRRLLLLFPGLPSFLRAQNLSTTGTADLFDGRSLAGWSIREGPESAYYVNDGCIVGSQTAEFPAWLRSRKRYENFELEFEFFLKGWMDGGVYFSAPEHGHKSRCGFKISLFHLIDAEPRNNSSGALFPLIPPRKVVVKNKGEWNTMKVRLDWPRLQVWSNGEVLHDLDVESRPELKYKLRSGYIGFETLSYPMRFRNIRITELASKQKWEVLYNQPSDLSKWHITESVERNPAKFEALGHVLHADGLGNLTTNEKYKDFELQVYARGQLHHNGGLLFRATGGRNRYEIQLHDVEEAHYPTGSLYSFKRARYPHVQAEQWALHQLIVEGPNCIVRIDGETVLEYDKLERLEAGSLELQAHQAGRWVEYKDIRVRRLGQPSIG